VQNIGGVECYVSVPATEYSRDKVVLFLSDVFGPALINNKVSTHFVVVGTYTTYAAF
jgi:hypothetical protein